MINSIKKDLTIGITGAPVIPIVRSFLIEFIILLDFYDLPKN